MTARGPLEALVRQHERCLWGRRWVCYHPLVARVTDEAAAAVIRDLAGGEHRLDELWAARPVVLVILRHFG